MKSRITWISVAVAALAIAGIAIRAETTHQTETATTTSASLPAQSSSTLTAQATAICDGTTPSTTYKHVVWIWMENKNTSEILHSPKAPFLDQIATQCGSSAHYTDLGIHPSEPNYIAATSGDTNGIHNDADAKQNAIDVDNLFHQVRNAGLSTKTYAEDMPTNCSQESSGKYASKHNPEPFYSSPNDLAACKTDNVPMTQFTTDLESGHLANFVTIVPNICNDMHSCSVSTGDSWLHNVVDQLTASSTYRTEPTAIFIMFDESEGAQTMPFFVVSPSVAPSATPDAYLNHFSSLRATEEMLGIQTFLGKATDNPGLRSAFHL